MKKKLMVLALAALLLCGCLTVGVLAAEDVIVLNEENGYVLDVKIHLVGDITGDGKANAKDYATMKKHINKTSLLTDYEFDCADINSDGKVNAKDYALLKKHINKTSPLW